MKIYTDEQVKLIRAALTKSIYLMSVDRQCVDCVDEAIALLDNPAVQEPAAYRYRPNEAWGWMFVELEPMDKVNYVVEPLYTSPQEKK